MSRIQKSKLMLNQSGSGLLLIQLHKVTYNFITTHLQVGNTARTSHDNTVIWYVMQNLVQPPASSLWTLNVLLNWPQHPTWPLPLSEQQQHFRFPQLNSSKESQRKKKQCLWSSLFVQLEMVWVSGRRTTRNALASKKPRVVQVLPLCSSRFL